MVNTFSEIEDKIFYNEEILFDKNKIKEEVFRLVSEKVSSKLERERPFVFEDVVYDFFDYLSIKLTKTQRTRDFGLDGILKLNLDLFGEINLGLQIKYSLIDSNDVDLFISSLKNAELQLGVIVCKDARKLDNYELNSKIRAILFSHGIKTKERLINEKINLNPVLIFKFEEMIEMVASRIRGVVEAVYKK